MYIAVFGDLHGRVLLPFYLMSEWQKRHDCEISLALCTGDVGVYRGLHTMDKASRRFALKDSAELGFSRKLISRSSDTDKFEQTKKLDVLFKDVSANMYFVPGNHEEHQYLGDIKYNYADSPNVPFPVDFDWEGHADGKYAEDEFRGYRKLWALPEGPVHTLRKPDSSLKFSTGDFLKVRAINGLPGYTMQEAWDVKGEERGVVLLSHETYQGRLKGLDPTGRLNRAGSDELLELIQKVAPQYHFFGHYHWYYPEMQVANNKGQKTCSIGLSEVAFDKETQRIHPGCFGILKVGEKVGGISFEIVDEEWFYHVSLEQCSRYL